MTNERAERLAARLAAAMAGFENSIIDRHAREASKLALGPGMIRSESDQTSEQCGGCGSRERLPGGRCAHCGGGG